MVGFIVGVIFSLFIGFMVGVITVLDIREEKNIECQMVYDTAVCKRISVPVKHIESVEEYLKEKEGLNNVE